MDLNNIHFSSGSIEQYFSKMNDETSLEVLHKLKENPTLHVGWIRIWFSPIAYFFHHYVVKRGYRAGLHGFINVACESIVMLVFVAKLWEYRWREREGKGLLPPVTSSELLKFKQW